MRRISVLSFCIFYLSGFISASPILFQSGQLKIAVGSGKTSYFSVTHSGKTMQGVTGKSWGIQQVRMELLNQASGTNRAWGVYRKIPKRPPLATRDFVGQGLSGMAGFFVGVIAGGTIGGVIDGTFSKVTRPGQWFNGGDETGILLGILSGGMIGPGIGVWLGGRTRTIKGNIGLTILGSIAGGILGWTAGIVSYGILSPLFIAGPVAGGMFMFNLSRKWAAPPDSQSTGSVQFPGGAYGSFTLLNLHF